jgi:hypothetical protein
MKKLKYFFVLIILLISTKNYSQDQSILIFDPAGASTNFQSTLSLLTEDPVFVADTIDENINNYDALFLFLGYSTLLSNEEGNKLVEYTGNKKPAYIYSVLANANIDSVDFWNYIGINEAMGLLVSVLVDSVTGVQSAFTQNVVIDTSFMSGYIPVIYGNVDSILIGRAVGWEVNTTFKSSIDSLNVIVDLYNLIDDYAFLESVLQQFKLIPPMGLSDDIIFADNFKLLQNYPNPFNPTTKIIFEVPMTGDGIVTLKVYDVLGREITTILNEEKPAGEYEVEFSGENLVSGVYYYTLTSGTFYETKKMILLR